ncbi:hypothetical protein N9K18_02660, partial [Candidatus Pelagibacter sp.]|nr:hypothetical protein [Candidatus Pelagibacter sp.]
STKDFRKLWKLKNKPFDLILGNRLFRKDPLLRIFLSKIVLRLFFLLYFKKHIIDANIPYRLIKNDFLKKFVKCCSKKYIAPNILMTIMANHIYIKPVNHFQRSKGVINWPLKKLFYFGIRLIYEIVLWKGVIRRNADF